MALQKGREAPPQAQVGGETWPDCDVVPAQVQRCLPSPPSPKHSARLRTGAGAQRRAGRRGLPRQPASQCCDFPRGLRPTPAAFTLTGWLLAVGQGQPPAPVQHGGLTPESKTQEATRAAVGGAPHYHTWGEAHVRVPAAGGAEGPLTRAPHFHQQTDGNMRKQQQGQRLGRTEGLAPGRRPYLDPQAGLGASAEGKGTGVSAREQNDRQGSATCPAGAGAW